MADANSLLLTSEDPESTIQIIAENVMSHLGADVFFNYILDAGGERLLLNAWAGVDERTANAIRHLKPGQAICGCVAQAGERIISEDVQHNGDSRAELVRKMGIRCYACHPLKAGTKTIGTLSFGTKRTDSFDAEDLELMRTVTNQVSIAMERARTQNDLGFQSFVLENVSDSVIAYYPDEPDKGKLVFANEAAYTTRGYTHDELLRLNVMDLIATEWRPRLQPRLDQLARGEGVRAESAHVRKDGSTFPVEVWLRRVSFGGRPLVVNVSRDITATKKAEERLQAALEAERAELARTRLLQEVAVAAGSDLNLETLVVRVLEAMERHEELRVGEVRLVDADDAQLQVLASLGPRHGADPGQSERERICRECMASRALATGRPLTHEDECSPRQRSDDVPSQPDGPESRHIALPLLYGDTALGVMSLSFLGRRSFTSQERELFEAVAHTVARAVENARLFWERSQQAEHAEALNRINAAVHSSLDFDEIMERVVVEVREALDVDAAVVQLRRDDYWEFAHEIGLPPEMRDAKPRDENAPLSVIVHATGQPVIVNDMERDPRPNPELARRFGLKSLLGTPITVRGQVIGVLFAYRFHAGAPFTRLPVDFLQKVAATLGLALENARLYQTEHDIADRLQSALLALPNEVQGVEFAHAYHSATEAARVGGDFYDLFELSQDHIGIVIGDVAGKGLDAAVLTSMVKNTIRAHASERGKTPKQILELTNDVVFNATPTESFATVFFGILDHRDGRLIYSNAGHTSAAKTDRNGNVIRLSATGPLLGAFGGMQFDQAETRLDFGELLFLYTDGLTEARRDRRFYGEDRVFAKLETAKDLPPSQAVREMLEDVLSYGDGKLWDDLAILVVRRRGLGLDIPHQQKLEM